jgi:hypothetical protein
MFSNGRDKEPYLTVGKVYQCIDGNKDPEADGVNDNYVAIRDDVDDLIFIYLSNSGHGVFEIVD